MDGASIANRVSVNDYLTAEFESEIKHEYVDGYLYEMTDFTNAHNMIAGNVLGLIHASVRFTVHSAWNSLAKIKISLRNQHRFYYPDASVIRHQNSLQDTWQENPVVIFEVLSPSTRCLDLGEKQEAYFTIPSLQHYVVLEQDAIGAIVFSRTENGFDRDVLTSSQDEVSLTAVDVKLKLSEFYEGVISTAS